MCHVMPLDGARVTLVTLQEGVIRALGDSRSTTTSNLTSIENLNVHLTDMKQTRHDRCASVVRVRAVSKAVKPRSCDCEASSSVQTGYSLLHEMLQ
ncbi:hypothetical protein E2C01_050825 [Portunus trituberculatus]|uniref:Uncharacterized protein n=1 Tax=Portunus trituberculatus TaxID=210409 RepID=A0A5B7GH54_PORTR|nr:hypothetical protein [Portunus trituberculatus]